MRRSLTVLLAALLVVSAVAPTVFAATAAASPAGMSSIPDGSVNEDVPAGESIPLDASELQNGRVMASEHADTLEIVLTTPDRAAEIMGADSAAISGNRMSVVLRDDTNSDGRRVALDAGRLKNALGYKPEAIYGTHEDGSEWTATAEYADGYLIFDVPHFSDNAVTFSGDLSISATPATNGSQFQYTVASNASIENVNLEFTGVSSKESNYITKQNVADGESFNLDLGGNAETDLTAKFEGLDSYSDGVKEGVYDGHSTYLSATDVSEQNNLTISGDLDGNIHARNSETGDTAWTYDPSSTSKIDQLHVSDSEGVVYVAQDSLYTLDLSDGSKLWSKSLSSDPKSVTANPESDRVYAATTAEEVVAIDKSTKNNDWKYSNPGGTMKDIDVNSSTGVIFSAVGYDDPKVHAINPDGSQNWVNSYTYAPSSVVVGNGNVYMSDDNGKIRKLNQDDGGKIWTYSAGNEIFALDIDQQSETVFAGAYPGDIYAINTDSSSAWTYSEMSNSVKVIAADESTGDVYGGGEGSGLHNVDYTSSTLDPELTVGSKSISYDGRLNKSQTFTETISVAPDSYNPTAATNDGKYNLNLSWTELTNTVNPNVSISSGNGSQTVEYASTLEDGVSTDLSDQIDATNIEGQTTLTVGLASPDSGPSPKVGLNYSHTAQNKISTNYTASKFEESYNTSTTYADSTDEAKLTIPFDSSSVVDVKTVEYRIDDSSWRQIGESNRRFENAELTAYIADEYGSSIPDGSTVDVRATGRKIDVENGRLTITDPTKPGEELDTQLEIQSRSSGFSLNVGPTANGKRVHYANSEDYTTDDYVVIEADGDQDLYLPKSKAGDRFRVKHLDTKVSADVGDVRIDVLEAGSEPKLDVSPGPGGAGDPVTIEYYNTRSGVEYLLNSVVDNIVVDSDIANSPAILEDDDSDDTWQILEEQTATGTSSSSSVTEVVGQFAAEQSSGLLGMISIPVLGSPLLWLVGFVGLGVVYWRTDFLSAASSSTSAGASVAANRSGSLLKTLVEKVGSGLLVVIRVLLDYSARIVALLTRNRSATIVTGILLTIFGTATGLIPIPPGVGIVVVGAGIPVASFLVLKRAGAYSQRVMILSSLGGILLGLSVVAPGAIQTAVAQLTSENVAPLLILATAGGGYLWWRQRNAEASTPDTVNRISFPTIRGGSDENNDGSN